MNRGFEFTHGTSGGDGIQTLVKPQSLHLPGIWNFFPEGHPLGHHSWPQTKAHALAGAAAFLTGRSWQGLAEAWLSFWAVAGRHLQNISSSEQPHITLWRFQSFQTQAAQRSQINISGSLFSSLQWLPRPRALTGRHTGLRQLLHPASRHLSENQASSGPGRCLTGSALQAHGMFSPFQDLEHAVPCLGPLGALVIHALCSL